GAAAAQVAIHLLRSPPGENEAVAMLVAAAGTALSQGAPQVAARYLRRALEEPLNDEERVGLLIDLGAAEVQAGDGNAVEHLTAAMRSARSAERRVDAALALAHALAAGGRAAESVEILTAVGDDLTSSHPELAGRIFSELVSLGDLI